MAGLDFCRCCSVFPANANSTAACLSKGTAVISQTSFLTLFSTLKQNGSGMHFAGGDASKDSGNAFPLYAGHTDTCLCLAVNNRRKQLHTCISYVIAYALKTHPFLPSPCEITHRTLTLSMCVAHTTHLLNPQHDY